MKTEKRFDVVIKNIKTGEVSAVIGKNMSEDRAEKRMITGLSRINEDFFIDIVETKDI